MEVAMVSGGYTIDQFWDMPFLLAVDRLKSITKLQNMKRAEFVIDMTVSGSAIMSGKKGAKKLQEHVDQLIKRT